MPGRGPSSATSARREDAIGRKKARWARMAPVEHLLDHDVGLVDELLDVLPRLSTAVPDGLPIARAPIEFDAAVGAEHAARCGGVGDEHIGVTAAKRGENRRHLVEPARHADAQIDAQQIFERQADHPIVERPADRLSPGVDEARRQHADRVAVDVALQLGGRRRRPRCRGTRSAASEAMPNSALLARNRMLICSATSGSATMIARASTLEAIGRRGEIDACRVHCRGDRRGAL